MKLNKDATRATINIQGEYSAAELEDLITQIAMARSVMLPPVPDTRPDPAGNIDKPILMESECAISAALRRDGSMRLWLRNRGIGWCNTHAEEVNLITHRIDKTH
jgi:hypothetical protein